MTFDFDDFYDKLLKRKIYFDKFPKGQLLRYKNKTLPLLKRSVMEKDQNGLSATLAVIYHDGGDSDYTDILLDLLDKKWHILIEDIVEVLGKIKDPETVNKLYEVAIDIPDWDEMRGLAKKCMWALNAIGTPEAIKKLEQLQSMDDWIIKENATFQLEKVIKKR
ncbi:HEAT repeat domain-containing protein [Mucilaginibacter sp.]|uniref:HEAT repeat domain-containing protein n=1 Tax=Mucilaginibacter sp. TaxID=1882438 RepID=UPI0035BC31B4